MKKTIRLIIGTAATMILLVSVLTACGGQEGSQVSGNQVASDNGSTEVMIVDDMAVTYEDYWLYLLMYTYTYSANADAITAENISSIFDTVTEQIKVEYIEYKLATVTEGVEVTQEALDAAKNNADSFVTYFGQEFLDKYGISKDAVDKMFVRQAYIDALKDKSLADLAADYKVEYESEYKDKEFYKIYYVLFPFENEKPSMSEENNLSASANQLYAKAIENVNGGELDGNLEELAEEFNVAEKSGSEYNFYGVYSIQELNDLVASLSENDISEPVRTDYGYMIVRMDEPNVEGYKDFAIEYMSNQQAENQYSTLQSNWLALSGQESVSANTTNIAWDRYVEMVREMNSKGYNISGGTQ